MSSGGCGDRVHRAAEGAAATLIPRRRDRAGAHRTQRGADASCGGTVEDGRWRDLAECIEQLVALDALPVDSAQELRQKIAAPRIDLVVAGQFKRGKTSLVNALIGHELLPVAVVPLTSVITIVTYGPGIEATIVFESGDASQIPVSELAAYVTERGNPNNERRVREAHIRCPSALLAGGIRLIDTPGVGSVYQANTDVTQRFLPKADAILFVLAADQPLSAAERDFLASVRPHAQRVFFLLNKADLLSERDLRESLEFTHDALESALGTEPALFPVSARLALRCDNDGSPATGSGFEPFLEALTHDLGNDRERIVQASMARKLVAVIDRGKFAAELALRSLAEPLAALADKTRRFEERKREILATRDDLDVLLGRDAARALRNPLELALATFTETLKSEVRDALDRYCASERGGSSRELARALEVEAVRVVRDGFERLQRERSEAIDAAFAAFCVRHAGRVDAIVDELYRFAAELFAVSYARHGEGGFGEVESHFRYKFWDEPPALRLISSALLGALPRAVAAPMLLARARERGVDLVDMQSGRLRHDFGCRIDEALARFRTTMGKRTDAAVAAIEAALARALALREAGESEAGRRGAELTMRLGALRDVGSRVAAAGGCVAEQPSVR
ncbi:MAG: dynamin family protein [Proteobacteria bacterium]|jgi:GTP-binding protein EngB required for normal cell division|nr:dynamin family protein [Pseudomonadota bacterium]